ncbi:glycosyltransferase family 4 protein [Mucilaginibacter arboris]|uniref:Glycosyltransferase n=1 Tax=Mucilaginibacter arboris TaxID=2682090 RepID=A0A7K1SY32_9SPHI|nr:glycosyltransferase family 4 protein [Mucilaginibacter arboris]MVN22229.1 glycosyltransferase [Mucilaginibacter arboris]
MNVFIVCTGLGHINRGYESFTRECYDALKDTIDFKLYLIKGGGKSIGNEIALPNLPRRKKGAQFLAKILPLDAYAIEQATFCISMLPLIFKKKPAVIYYSDFVLGTYLWHLRKYLKFKYKLLFSNGAPNGPPFKTEDHVQQLLPVYLEEAIRKGAPAEMQTLLPYGFNININERLNSLAKKKLIRKQLGLSPTQKVILSVGAINTHHKRMDYLIDEVAKLGSEYFLVILGQFEAETPQLINLATTKLMGRFTITNVPQEDVKDYYIAADYFVLASLNEGFGRVLIEALSYGLPCIVHNYINAKQVLGEYGIYLNMENEGELTEYFSIEKTVLNKESLIKAAHSRYSWSVLKKDYLKMISALIN